MLSLFFSILVSKPSNNNNNSHHTSHNNQPTRPPPPRPAPPSAGPNPMEYRDEPESSSDEEVTKQADILNMKVQQENMHQETPKIAKVKEPSFDLLGGFDTGLNSPFPDLLGSAMNKPTIPPQSGNGLDDIFGSLPPTTAPAMAPSKSSSDLNGLNLNFDAFGGTTTTTTSKTTTTTNSSATFDPFGNFIGGSSAGVQTQQGDVKKDPFADIGNVGANLNPTWSQNKNTSSPMVTPIHQQGAPTTATASPRGPSTPIHQMKSPDYSRSHFATDASQGNNAPKTKSADIFGDILGSQGYSFGSKTSQGPKSINDMRKVELSQTMDPERLKIMEWVRFYKIVKRSLSLKLLFTSFIDGGKEKQYKSFVMFCTYGEWSLNDL